MIRFTYQFTKHARRRCIQRNIDESRIRRQLLSIPYNDQLNQTRRWDIPDTNLFVVFTDERFKRKIITVSFRSI